MIPVDRIALVIGVTGHDDLARSHEPALMAAFGALLDDLARDHPGTPIVIVAPLGAGAELTAVEEALARELPVVAALAAEPAAYVARFPSPTRERIAAAIARCTRVEVAGTRTEPDVARFQAGMFVAHHSHLVVAFWDGLPKEGLGETARVVDVRLSGIVPDYSILGAAALPDLGPVVHVRTPRGDDRDDAAFTSERLLRAPGFAANDDDSAAAATAFDAAIHAIDAYNTDLATLGGEGDGSLEALRDRTDAVANAMQRTTYRFLLALYAIATAATALQYIANQVVRFAALAVAFVFYRIARSNDYENRFQDYRVLSEALRVQGAWRASGLNGADVERCYLDRQQSDLLWIRFALRYAAFAIPQPAGDTSVTSVATRDWIDGQCAFYQTSPRRQERILARIRRWTRALFWTALGVTVIAFILLYAPALAPRIAAVSPALDPAWLRAIGTRNHALLASLSTAALTVYAAIALLISNYTEKRAYAQNIKRYARMYAVFTRAKRLLEAMGPSADSDAGRRIVRDLGEEALIEQAEWLLNRRERPFTFVS